MEDRKQAVKSLADLSIQSLKDCKEWGLPDSLTQQLFEMSFHLGQLQGALAAIASGEEDGHSASTQHALRLTLTRLFIRVLRSAALLDLDLTPALAQIRALDKARYNGGKH